MAAVHKKAPRSVELVIPIDTSEIEDRGELKELKALLVESSGETQSGKIKLGDDGKAQAVFKLARPRAARVIVGPPDASDEELEGLQTLAVDVPLRVWSGKRKLELSPLIVRPWYWYWWLRWCRTFTIRGRLLCPDGSPVPGAEVCAYDVDRLWWWCSERRRPSAAAAVPARRKPSSWWATRTRGSRA